MHERDRALAARLTAAELAAGFDRELQSLDLAMEDRRSLRIRPRSARWIPQPRAHDDCAVWHLDRVVLQQADRWVQDGFDFLARRPPGAVVALDQDLASGTLAEPIEVRLGLSEIEAPRSIPADENPIFRANHRIPGDAHLVGMPEPVVAEDVHRLVDAEAQVQVADGEESQCGQGSRRACKEGCIEDDPPMLKRAAATSLVPLALLVACASAPKPSETPSGCDPALWRRASQLHHAATVVDTHTDTTSRILDEGFDMGPRAPDGHMDLPRIREGGLDVAFYSIYVASRFYGDEAPLFAKKPGDDDWPRPTDAGTANGSARRAMAMIDGLVRTADRYPDQMTVCASLEEIRATVAAGRHAACMGIEGGHAIEGQLALLRLFHQLGVRYMTLTHTNHNEYADSCADAVPRWGGLNTLGQKVVKEMNRLGMMVDVSHVSDNAFRDVLAVTRAPVICSHSSMRALCDHPRNVTDDMLRLLAQNDGVVMVNYNCGFVDAEYQKRSSQSSQTRKIQEREARRRLAEGSPELEEALKNLDARFPTP